MTSILNKAKPKNLFFVAIVILACLFTPYLFQLFRMYAGMHVNKAVLGVAKAILDIFSLEANIHPWGGTLAIKGLSICIGQGQVGFSFLLVSILSCLFFVTQLKVKTYFKILFLLTSIVFSYVISLFRIFALLGIQYLTSVHLLKPTFQKHLMTHMGWVILLLGLYTFWRIIFPLASKHLYAVEPLPQ